MTSTLIDLQKILSDKISTLYKNFCKEPTARRTPSFLIKREQTLKELWSKFDERHETIFVDTPQEDREIDEYLSGELYNSTAIIQEQMNDKIAEWRDHHLINANPSTDGDTNQVADIRNDLKLPPIKIESFNGDYHKWTSFKAIYESLIHNNIRISGVEKLHYLKSNLEGEASRLINHLLLTENNYEAAWALLKKRYDNSRILINTELKRLINQPSITNENSIHLRHFLDQIQESLNTLKSLNVELDTWDPILIYIFVQKLDSETHKQWELSLTNPTDLPSLKDFLTFIETRFFALENITKQFKWINNKPNQRISNYPAQTNSFHSRDSTGLSCPLCQGHHTFKSCSRFLDSSTRDRFEIIKQLRKCSNCFGSHHIQQCSSKSTCFRCGMLHHTMLHSEDSISARSKATNHQGNNNPFSRQTYFNQQQTGNYSMGQNMNNNFPNNNQSLIHNEYNVAPMATEKLHDNQLNRPLNPHAIMQPSFSSTPNTISINQYDYPQGFQPYHQPNNHHQVANHLPAIHLPTIPQSENQQNANLQTTNIQGINYQFPNIPTAVNSIKTPPTTNIHESYSTNQ